MRRVRSLRLWSALLVVSGLLVVADDPASAASLTGLSVRPSNPAANASGSSLYTLSLSGSSGTTARCIEARFEGNDSTVPAPSHPGWLYSGGSTTDGSKITLSTPSQSFMGSIAAYTGAVPSEGLHVTFDGYIGGGSGG